MLRLYVDAADAALAPGGPVRLPPGPARHLQVRRLQPGDALVVFDGGGGEWIAAVESIGRVEVTVRLDRFVAVERELPQAVTLAVGMPANERMDWLVEKAGELGAAALLPLHCERSVLKLEGERAERKRAHWQAIAVAACEQSGRTRLLQVKAVQTLKAALATATLPAARWLLRPQAAAPPPVLAADEPLVVLSGPEGGLTEGEEAAARGAGFAAVGLGARVLRAETAPLAVLAHLGLR